MKNPFLISLFYCTLLATSCGAFTQMLNTEKIYLSEDGYNRQVDLWGIIATHPRAEIVLESDITVKDTPKTDMTVAQLHIDGRGHTIHLKGCLIVRNVDVAIENVVFDCGDASKNIIYAIGTGEDRSFIVRNCTFLNTKEVTTLCARKYSDVLIENCKFSGTVVPTSQRQTQGGASILIYECNHDIVIRGNEIRNCFGFGIDGIGFTPDKHSNVMVENNIIDHVTGGGIVFTGGEVWNATVKGNKVSNTHCLGNQFEGESNGGPNSAVNFHGFRNAVVENNMISTCPKSVCFDFDGSISGVTGVAKGTGLIVKNNTCIDVGPVALFVVKDAVFKDNEMSNNATNTSEMFVLVRGASNVTISGNRFDLKKGKAKNFYPFILSDNGDTKSGMLRIKDNIFSTNGHMLVFVNQHYTGKCQVGDNDILFSSRNDGTLSVANNSKAKVTIPKSNRIVWYK